MEVIKQWAFSACAAMIAGGLAQMLAPKSGMERMFKLVASVFFLCCLLSPAVLRKPELMLELDEVEIQSEIDRRSARLSEAAEEQVLRSTESELEKLVGDKLEQMGIKVHDVTINITINGQNETPEITAEVILDREHENRHDALVAELRREFGISVYLGYAG